MNRMMIRCAAFFIAVLMVTGCSSQPAGSSSGSAAASAVSVSSMAAGNYKSEDISGDWNEASATAITFHGTSAEIEGTGAAAEGANITITAGGTYVLSGSLEDGQVFVNAGKDQTVRIVLNGVSLSSSTTSPLYIQQADKVILTLAEGTENQVTDAKSYIYPDSSTDEPDAALFSKEDLTINGAGSLSVTGQYRNGIASKDDLVITGGNITVTAVEDALRGRDSVSIQDGIFTLEAGVDGIKSNNDTDAEKGWITLDGGTYHINAGNDGIQAETVLTVNGGDYEITTAGGSGGTLGEGDSAKGLKAGGSLSVSGGTFLLNTADDAVHTNASASVTDGSFTIDTGDDGFHADESLVISGGTINIRQSYEGLEGSDVTISGGTIRLKASDDGINSAGGSDTNIQGGRPGQDMFRSADKGNYFVRVTGGYLVVDADGDGLDSNGELYIDGGTVLVNGPTGSGNGALDYDGACEITGGILIAAGSAGMAQAPGATSSQNSLMVYFSSQQKAGTLVNLYDKDGKTVASFAPAKDFQTVIISAPELKQGEAYTLSTGGSDSGTEQDGYYTGGAYTGGTKLADIVLTGSVTSVNDDGSQASGMTGGFGGRGNRGGMGRPMEPGADGAAPPDGFTPVPGRKPGEQTGETQANSLI